MDQVPSEAEPIHSVQRRAMIYLWDHPTLTALSRMDLRAQRTHCSAWAMTRGWPIVEILVDDALALPDSTRPALEQLRAAVQEQRCEVLVIPALASLGPQVMDVLALLDILARHGVDLVSLHESFDTTSAYGSFAMLVVRALAHIAQGAEPVPPSVAPTLAPAAALLATPMVRAKRRSELPFGYLQTVSGIVIDSARAPIVRRIFLLRDAGATVPELVQLLRAQGGGRWNQRTVAAVLAHEDAYRGGPDPDGGRWPTLLEER
jgi:site-specific DNA recombinase